MSKDSGNFLRKVVRFVANPTTDWTELDAPSADAGESDYAKSEIKAMIERKRRNDFVRKRELDMLRKIRREGLSPDNAMALGGSSNLDSDSRPQNGTRSDIAVKAKIDEIEQQMVGAPPRMATAGSGLGGSLGQDAQSTAPSALTAPATLPFVDNDPPPQISQAVLDAARASLPWMPEAEPTQWSSAFPQAVELVHDPELDEAVIAFANADFDQCERCLQNLITPGGARHEQSESWLVLLDLYRALDLPQKFDHLALAYAQHFGVSAPQWFSLPEKVAAFHALHAAPADGPSTIAETAPTAAQNSLAGSDVLGMVTAPDTSMAGWLAPGVIDHDAVSQLRAEALQLPRPWTLDWSGVHIVTAQGADDLRQLTRQWASEGGEFIWMGVEHFIQVLADATPTGNRDIDPAFWMLRLDVLLLCNRAAEFDEVAIDYCITYETSPPSWEAIQCRVRVQSDGAHPHTRALSQVSEVTTTFVESRLHQDVEYVQVAALHLSGQLVGDIGSTLSHLETQLGASVSLSINCEHLLRVDFIAAGDLLNWVLARRTEDRQVTFLNPHRLVAMFFGAMGINEHATVRLQTA